MSDPLQNVTQIRNKRPKQQRSVELLQRFRRASEIEAPTEVPYLIKGWLAPRSLAVLYGAANVGKTFLALDIAHAVSRGASWGGCRVQTAPVLYVTLEGGAGFDKRVAALENPCFWVLSAPLSFTDPRRDPTFLAEAIEDLEEEAGPFGLIIIDTLARAMSPGDENSSQDMGRLIASAEMLKERTGACVLLIHHTGKSAAQGARGHSSLRAAVDTEIEVTKEDGSHVIEAEATKQRDMPRGTIFRYRLSERILGKDQDGDDISTCVVERAADGEEPRRAKVKGKAEIALQALHTAIERHGVQRTGPDYPDGRSVTKEQWRSCAELHGLFEGLEHESAKRTFNRAIGELNDKGLARSFNEIWWLA
ncbi:AAA family ATPase [Paenirhodobacter sp.]|uniref:AAA family ATPase n=1 Tax=Paenirhodobacter sp. TaxID=1965326 RepID=UPI003B50231A